MHWCFLWPTTEGSRALLPIWDGAGGWPKGFLWHGKPRSLFSVPAMRQFQNELSIFEEFQATTRSWQQIAVDALCLGMMSWLGTWIFTICLGEGRVQCRWITRAHLCRAPHVTCVSMTFCWLFAHADTLPISIFLRWTSHTWTFQRVTQQDNRTCWLSLKQLNLKRRSVWTQSRGTSSYSGNLLSLSSDKMRTWQFTKSLRHVCHVDKRTKLMPLGRDVRNSGAQKSWLAGDHDGWQTHRFGSVVPVYSFSRHTEGRSAWPFSRVICRWLGRGVIVPVESTARG